MQFLKGLGIGFTGFFLAIALLMLCPLYVVHSTVLNPQFTIAQIQNLDVNSLVREFASKNLPADSQPYLEQIDKTLNEIKPWSDRQIAVVINSLYNYLQNQTDTLDISIETDSVKPVLIDSFTQAFLDQPPVDYAKLSATDKAIYIKDLKQQISDAIPSPIKIQQSDIPENMVKPLEKGREIIPWVQQAFWIMLGVSLLLIGGIIAIWRQVKGSTRTLSIIFILVGLTGAIAYFIVRQVVPGIIKTQDFQAALQQWLPQIFKGLISPWGVYSLTILGIGIVLWVVSLIAGRRKTRPV